MSCAPPVALRECQSRLLPGESTAQACAQDVHAPCTIGTQVSAECNQSLYTTAQPRTYTSGANARAEPEKVALLLPQSPAANTERVSSMSGTPTVADGAHCGQSSGRSSEKAGAGHAYRAEGAGCVDKGGVRSSGNVPEQDVQVFADTLGMQGGGMAGMCSVISHSPPCPHTIPTPCCPAVYSADRIADTSCPVRRPSRCVNARAVYCRESPQHKRVRRMSTPHAQSARKSVRNAIKACTLLHSPGHTLAAQTPGLSRRKSRCSCPSLPPPIPSA